MTYDDSHVDIGWREMYLSLLWCPYYVTNIVAILMMIVMHAVIGWREIMPKKSISRHWISLYNQGMDK